MSCIVFELQKDALEVLVLLHVLGRLVVLQPDSCSIRQESITIRHALNHGGFQALHKELADDAILISIPNQVGRDGARPLELANDQVIILLMPLRRIC